MELPNDFPHTAPQGYRYEVIQSKTNVISIWTVFERGFTYNDHNESHCIWGFYNTKTGTYSSPINSTKCGDPVDISDTRDYTAMQLNLNPLEYVLYS